MFLCETLHQFCFLPDPVKVHDSAVSFLLVSFPVIWQKS